jgi:putative acetyltransferase
MIIYIMIEIVQANTDELIAKAKELFQEYAESLGFDLCFQNFNAELDSFPKHYSPPAGCLFLALSQSQPIGCVGLRYFEKGICEMKRLYVRPNFREKNAGRQLAEAAIKAGKTLGYERMRLDTLPSMEIAHQLYKSLGFVEIGPYRHNPIEGVLYLELRLKRL